MDEHKTSTRPCSVFVVCEAGSYLHILVELFKSLGLRNLNWEPVTTLGASFSTTALDLIHRADMVCVLLDRDVSPNVYFELGYAAGQGRPIAIIGDKPRNLGEFPEAFFILSSLQDRSALSFQLRAFVDKFQ
jgi:hypothetical protein